MVFSPIPSRIRHPQPSPWFPESWVNEHEDCPGSCRATVYTVNKATFQVCESVPFGEIQKDRKKRKGVRVVCVVLVVVLEPFRVRRDSRVCGST